MEQDVKKSKKLYVVELDKEKVNAIRALTSIIEDVKNGLIDNSDLDIYLAQLDISKETQDEIKKLSKNVDYRDALITEIGLKTGSNFSTINDDFYELLNKLDAIKNADISEYSLNIIEDISKHPDMNKIVKGEELYNNRDEEEEESIRKFVPDDEEAKEAKEEVKELIKDVESDDEKQKIVKEFYEKKYYLTGERLVETLRNSSFYKNIPSKMQYMIEQQYLKCSDPNDFKDPLFLNKALTDDLGLDEMTYGWEGIHQMLLGNTYVGYHIEEVNGADTKNPDTNKIDVALIDAQKLANDTPASIRPEGVDQFIRFLCDRIKDVTENMNPYSALAIMDAPDQLYDESETNWFSQLDKTDTESTRMMIFVRDHKDEMKQDMEAISTTYRPALELRVKEQERRDREIRREIIRTIRNNVIAGALVANPALGATESIIAGMVANGIASGIENSLDKNEEEKNNGLNPASIISNLAKLGSTDFGKSVELFTELDDEERGNERML